MQTLINQIDVKGDQWDVVFVFDSTIPYWGETLVEEGYWIPLSWGGFDNAIGFSWRNVPHA